MSKDLRTCKTCGEHPEILSSSGHRTGGECGTCRYERHRISRLSWKYGISEDEYLEMHEAQSGCCKICGIHESKLPKRLHVDHCHDTGKVRGLLCAKCNTSIGQFERTPELLLRAYEHIVGGG